MKYSERNAYTQQILDQLRAELANASQYLGQNACIYATGSFGRGEASPNSDCDLFIGAKASNRDSDQKLSQLDEICVKANLIHAVRKLGLPDFDRDGEYLRQHTVYDFERNLGNADDDKENTFTARLLLLLESTPVIGEDVYDEILDSVVEIYWRDYHDHDDEFKPMFLVNDIQRLWRTLCVSYETGRSENQKTDDSRKRKARVKNYKLKYSRVMTCYSAILYLLWVYQKEKTVGRERAREMIRKTPMDRIIDLRDQTGNQVFNEIIEEYEKFLEISAQNEEQLMEELDERGKRDARMEQANKFGRHVAKALRVFENGEGDELFDRLLV